MRQEQSSIPPWLIILLLVLGVVIIVIIALLLSQIDNFQRRSAVPSNGLGITDLEATIAAEEVTTIYLPSAASPTFTPYATPTGTEPVVDRVTPTVPPVKDKTTPSTAPVNLNTHCPGGAAVREPYIVQHGDSLSSIATRFGVSEIVLYKFNCLSHGRLIEGQQINLPHLNHHSAGPSTFNEHPTSETGAHNQVATPPWPIPTPTKANS